MLHTILILNPKLRRQEFLWRHAISKAMVDPLYWVPMMFNSCGWVGTWWRIPSFDWDLGGVESEELVEWEL